MFTKTANTPNSNSNSTSTPATTPAAPTTTADAAKPAAREVGGLTLPTDPAPQAKKAKATTLIAEGMAIEGGVVGDGELHVDGVVRGDIRVPRVTIGESGQVEGSIVAETLENRGRIVGSVTSKQVRLYTSAHVEGDITHEQLAMELGAFFQGRSLKFQRGAEAALPASTSASVAKAEPKPEPKVFATPRAEGEANRA